MVRSAPHLSRRGPIREPKRRFVLYCEGSNAERDYFDALRGSWNATLIDVEIIGGVGVPQTVTEKAIAKLKDIQRQMRKERNSFEKKDEVWAVFDRDENPNYDKSVERCEAVGVRVARSNPCFELWLILHFQDFNKPDGHVKVQRYLKKIHPEYDPQHRKTLDCMNLMEFLEEAENRAARQLISREEERQPYGRPSTTVHELTRAVRRAAEEAS